METSLKMLIFSIVLIQIIYRSHGLPSTLFDESEVSSLNHTQLNYDRRLKNPDAYTHRKILSKGTSSLNNDNSNDGKIVFPTDSESTESQQFLPTLTTKCENNTFCENTSNYPNDYIENVLRMNKDFKFFSEVDTVPDVIHRINTSPEDASLCDSHEKVVYPKVAQNKDKEWLFVVNQGEYTQGVRVEICGKENDECNIIDGFTEGYKTFCKQKYIYRQLVAVSSAGQLKPEMFRFPASCCCHVKFIGSPSVRIGLNTSKKSEVSSSRFKENN